MLYLNGFKTLLYNHSGLNYISILEQKPFYTDETPASNGPHTVNSRTENIIVTKASAGLSPDC